MRLQQTPQFQHKNATQSRLSGLREFTIVADLAAKIVGQDEPPSITVSYL